MASYGEDGNTNKSEANTVPIRNKDQSLRGNLPANSTTEIICTPQDGFKVQTRSKKSQEEYLPLVRFLFSKGEEQVQKVKI